MSSQPDNAAPMIEKHTIGAVPREERHGKVRDLFTLWFGGNIAPLPIVTGALGVQIYGLSFFWAISALIAAGGSKLAAAGLPSSNLSMRSTCF